VRRAEQLRISARLSWSYLCLETEIPVHGDFRTTFLGEMPVIVVRDPDEEIYAFESGCAHWAR
jgi:anthranilate 1,2-dioxygenase large subunit/terephthalate 1,2-dioxygenase oxygenase component alpha subunit